MKTIKALTKAIANDDMGVETTHHVIGSYFVDLASHATQATVLSYVSATTKRSVNTITINAAGTPPDGVGAAQWIYEQILANSSPANALADAAPVYAEA